MTAPYTLAELRESLTLEDATDDVIDLLDGEGFDATSWQDGSPERTIAMTVAYLKYALRKFTESVSYLGFNDDSSDDALTAFSSSHYDNTRVAAVATQGTVVLTGGLVGPPHTISVGGHVVSDGTRTFRNTTGGTVTAGGTLSLTYQAEVAGTGGNVANSTITTMVTTLAGVTCTNPAIGGTGTWITRLGVNAELDAALQARNSAKWSTLSSIEAISDRYESVARTVVANCRVKVDTSNPGGPGTVTVYVAGQSGAATSGERALVDAAIDANKFGSVHTTSIASSDSLVVTGTVYYDSDYTAAAMETAVEAAIDAYINAANIGGYNFSPGPSAIIDIDGIDGAVRNTTGVRLWSRTLPAANFAVGTYHVAVPGTHVITYTAVTS